MCQNFFNECVNKRIKRLSRMCSICKGTSPKKKTDLIEMIVYECMTETLNKNDLEDISNKEAKHTK